MSPHDYGPEGFPKSDARLGLTDLYAFCKPVRQPIRNYATERSHQESNLLGTQTTAGGAS
jgi:hypothetical protein